MKNAYVLTLLILSQIVVLAQTETVNNPKEDALKVFMDCDFCDLDYMRRHICYVNYVRDTKAAQVHILTTTQTTGSGGTEYIFNFIGQLEFLGQDNTISVGVRADATSDERREMRIKFLKIGLMPYVAQTPMVDFINIEYTNSTDSTETEEVVDKWDYWVFRLSANGWFNGEEIYKSKDLGSSITANRIKDKWKFETWGNFGYSESTYELDSVTTIKNSNRNYFLESSAVRAINDHWSAGIMASVNSSTYSNIDFSHRIRPAVEYNVFDYADFTRKQIRFQYRIAYTDFQYVDTTIYNNISENLFNHSLSVAAEFKQKWGSIYLSSTASQYLHDPSLKRLTIYSGVSWRILKGLSINASGNVEFIQDQISLPKGGATEVEILTQQRQLATQYYYWGSLGISYTFGSIYNNIVNPRFGN